MQFFRRVVNGFQRVLQAEHKHYLTVWTRDAGNNQVLMPACVRYLRKRLRYAAGQRVHRKQARIVQVRDVIAAG